MHQAEHITQLMVQSVPTGASQNAGNNAPARHLRYSRGRCEDRSAATNRGEVADGVPKSAGGQCCAAFQSVADLPLPGSGLPSPGAAARGDANGQARGRRQPGVGGTFSCGLKSPGSPA
jgi:hypothetical protein